MPAVMTVAETAFARAVSRLIDGNPFLPERIAAERAALGRRFVASPPVWSIRAPADAVSSNVTTIERMVFELVPRVRARLVRGKGGTPRDRALYQDLVLYALYARAQAGFFAAIQASDGAARRRAPGWDAFRRELAELSDVPGSEAPTDAAAAHLFACFFQIRRAFHEIFTHIVGGSLPAARLRAAVWQSIFTRDMRAYQRALWRRMGDVTTLVTGPSGTGKELVARAIARSRYVPFDPGTESFAEDFAASFHPLNLSALSPTLIESELFGHRKGAFTGALQDRAGWLEVCRPLGTVFLDEIGDLEPGLQVKLLRVIEGRTFQRIGDTVERRFHGKIIAATNRDLGADIAAGRFREDFYFRLCSDLVVTPSLSEQIAGAPHELASLVRHVARRIAGDEGAPRVADDATRVISRDLPRGYAWPGNVRELEQCVRNVMIRGAYHPPRPAPARGDLARQLEAGALTASALLDRYCAMVYARTGSYLETARRLDLDRRTVRARVAAARVS